MVNVRNTCGYVKVIRVNHNKIQTALRYVRWVVVVNLK